MTAITQDYQARLVDDDFLMGDGTDIRIARQGEDSILGLVGTPDLRTGDLEPSFADGVVGGQDNYSARLVVLPLKTVGAAAETARERLQPLLDVWQTPRNTVVPLDVRLPGQPETVLRYYGRPRAIDENRILWHGDARAMFVNAHFECLDPYAYGAEDSEEADNVSPLVIQNIGNVRAPAKSRCTITAVSSAAEGTITNLDDPDGLTMRFVNMEGETFVIDLYTWSVTVGGSPRGRQTRPDSGWPVLVPGQNRFAFTGFTSLAATWRPAYL